MTDPQNVSHHGRLCLPTNRHLVRSQLELRCDFQLAGHNSQWHLIGNGARDTYSITVAESKAHMKHYDKRTTDRRVGHWLSRDTNLQLSGRLERNVYLRG